MSRIARQTFCFGFVNSSDVITVVTPKKKKKKKHFVCDSVMRCRLFFTMKVLSIFVCCST